MDRIGVREFKEQASEILRRVREKGDSFEVTYHGRAIARLVPVMQPEDGGNLDAFWQRWTALEQAISAEWPEGVSAAEAVQADRREL